jgi:lipoprotein-releasing system permease protein
LTAWWLAYRYFGSLRSFFSLTTTLSLIGMTISVSSLVVSMAVFSGYIATLEQTLQDAFGHILVFKRGSGDQAEMIKDIQPALIGLVAKTPFVYAEAILAHQGKISGVLIEGVDEATVRDVLSLDNRVIAGSLKLSHAAGSRPKVMIGKGIAERFHVQVGDVINLVIPLATEFQAGSFRPKLGKFEIAGVINYGRYDFDSRYVMMSLPEAQDFLEMGKRITGYRLRIADPYQARAIAQNISNNYGPGFWAKDWLEVNRNLFEAAKLEKAVLFFVLMILVVAAAFNIANALYISVVQRYRDISVLKTLGASDKLIRRVFTCQGLMIGATGAILGIVVGLLVCRVFEWAQVRWKLIPAEVYKIDHINLQVRSLDLLSIVGAALLVCFIATLVPSRRGAKISPVEGLRYE